jgi:hypothetical protein
MIEMTRDFDARESIERCQSEVTFWGVRASDARPQMEGVRLEFVARMHRMIASCRGSEGLV